MGVFSTHFVPLISILASKIMEELNNQLFGKQNAKKLLTSSMDNFISIIYLLPYRTGQNVRIQIQNYAKLAMISTKMWIVMAMGY